MGELADCPVGHSPSMQRGRIMEGAITPKVFLQAMAQEKGRGEVRGIWGV